MLIDEVKRDGFSEREIKARIEIPCNSLERRRSIMPERNMDTVFGAKGEWFSSATAASKELDTAILMEKFI